MKLPKLNGSFLIQKKQWFIAGAILLLLLAVGIYFYLDYRKKKKAHASTEGDASVIPLIPDNANLFKDCPNDSFPLKYGKCGKRIEQFQMYLLKQYGAQFSAYGIDGKWGDETEVLANKFITKNAPFSISEDYFNKTGMGGYKTVKYA
jgi:hypothetical protein